MDGSVFEELTGPRRKTEVDVIKDWLVNIFQPVEKTADMVVTDFKFEQFGGNSGRRPPQQQQQQQRNNCSNSNGCGRNGDSSGRNGGGGEANGNGSEEPR